MKTKHIVIFFLCILVLAASEYVFLSELGSHQRILILIGTSLLAIASIVAIFLTYRGLASNN